jgi:hypothetical protein
MRPKPNYYSRPGCVGPLPSQHFSPYPEYDVRNPGYRARPNYQEDPIHFRKPGSNVHPGATRHHSYKKAKPFYMNGDGKVETRKKKEKR